MQQMMRESDKVKIACHVIHEVNRDRLASPSWEITGSQLQGKGARSESPTRRKHNKPNLDGCAFVVIIYLF